MLRKLRNCCRQRLNEFTHVNSKLGGVGSVEDTRQVSVGGVTYSTSPTRALRLYCPHPARETIVFGTTRARMVMGSLSLREKEFVCPTSKFVPNTMRGIGW